MIDIVKIYLHTKQFIDYSNLILLFIKKMKRQKAFTFAYLKIVSTIVQRPLCYDT